MLGKGGDPRYTAGTGHWGLGGLDAILALWPPRHVTLGSTVTCMGLLCTMHDMSSGPYCPHLPLWGASPSIRRGGTQRATQCCSRGRRGTWQRTQQGVLATSRTIERLRAGSLLCRFPPLCVGAGVGCLHFGKPLATIAFSAASVTQTTRVIRSGRAQPSPAQGPPVWGREPAGCALPLVCLHVSLLPSPHPPCPTRPPASTCQWEGALVTLN